MRFASEPSAPSALSAFVFAIALVANGCSDATDRTVDDRASGGTIAIATLPPVATTSAPVVEPTGSSPVVSPASSTTVGLPAAAAPASSVNVSTTARPAPTVSTSPPSAAAPPCRLDLIVEQTQTQYVGITPSDLSCAEDWAAWIGRPDDELGDGFFAVARWTGTSWELLNLGSAGVCADGGVPDDLWEQLGCFE